MYEGVIGEDLKGTVDSWTTGIWTAWINLYTDFFQGNITKFFFEICNNLKKKKKTSHVGFLRYVKKIMIKLGYVMNA